MSDKHEPRWTTTPLGLDLEELLKPWVGENVNQAVIELIHNLDASIDIDRKGQPIVYLSAGEWMTEDGLRTIHKEIPISDLLTRLISSGSLGSDDSVTPEDALERIQDCINKARAELHVRLAS